MDKIKGNRRIRLCAIAMALMVGSIIFVGMFNTGLDVTNTTEFCTSCHTMQYNFKELKQTAHWNNRSGVKTGCADCHVPKEFFPKLKAKIIAAKDVWHEIIGTIDTPEKFERRRWKLANAVWQKMEADNSQQCRNCHSFGNMLFAMQDKSARKKHMKAEKTGRTCIECHKGIAHEEPDEPEEEEASG